MNKIDTTEFNIFELNEIVERKTLVVMTEEIFNRYQFLDDVNEEKLREFVSQISIGYNRDVQYHNDLHAADVLQTVFYLLYQSDLDKVQIF